MICEFPGDNTTVVSLLISGGITDPNWGFELITNGYHNKQLLFNIDVAHLLFIQRPTDVFMTRGMGNAVVISYKYQNIVFNLINVIII